MKNNDENNTNNINSKPDGAENRQSNWDYSQPQNTQTNIDNQYQSPKDLKKAQNHEASQKTAHVGGKAAASYFGGKTGGALYNKLSQTKFGKKVESTVGKGLEKNPITKFTMRKANQSGALDVADQATNLMDNSNQVNKEGLLDNRKSGIKDNFKNKMLNKNRNGELKGTVDVIKDQIKNKIMLFIIANPWVLLIFIGFIMVIFLIFFVVVINNGSASAEGAGKYSNNGLYAVDNSGLAVVDFENIYITVNDSNGVQTGQYRLETYVAGVITRENGGAPLESLKAQAVASRTFVLKETNNGKKAIENSTNKQVFTEDITSNALSATKETKGQVMKDQSGNYVISSFASYPSSKKIHNWSGNACTVPVCDETTCTVKIYRMGSDYSGEFDFTMPRRNAEGNFWNGSDLTNQSGHCYGMSQLGANYLATLGKSYIEILNTFYDFELAEVEEFNYQNHSYYMNTKDSAFLTQRLSSYLASKGTSAEAYNNAIKNNVVKAGAGTRYGVAAAAGTLVVGLAQYGVKLPYTYYGGHSAFLEGINKTSTSYYGIDKNWGYTFASPQPNDGNGYAENYGPDCSAFVSWAIHNGGFDIRTLTSGSLGDLGPNHLMDGSYIGQPGDLIWHSGHIMLIVSVDKDNNLYYIAEAQQDSMGVIIRPQSFKWRKNYIVDMTSWYENNKTSDYETKFNAGLI